MKLLIHYHFDNFLPCWSHEYHLWLNISISYFTSGNADTNNILLWVKYCLWTRVHIFKWMSFYLSERWVNVCTCIGTDPLAARRGWAFCGRSGVWAARPTSRDSSRPPAAETRWEPPFCRRCTGSSCRRRGHGKKTFRSSADRSHHNFFNHCRFLFVLLFQP